MLVLMERIPVAATYCVKTRIILVSLSVPVCKLWCFADGPAQYHGETIDVCRFGAFGFFHGGQEECLK